MKNGEEDDKYRDIGLQSMTKLSVCSVRLNGNQEVEKNLSASKTRFHYCFQEVEVEVI